MAAKVI